MSCLLVSIGSIWVDPAKMTLRDMIGLMVRDLVWVIVHIVMLVIYGSDPCLFIDSGVLVWVLLDTFVTLMRLVRTPLQFLVNRSVRPRLLGWSRIEHCLMARNETPCSSLGFVFIDWLSYLSWMIGLWMRPSSECVFRNPLAYMALIEILVAAVGVCLFVMTLIIVFSLNRCSNGYLLPGFELDADNWPSSCPSIRLDRSKWRHSGESRSAYRARRRHEFNQSTLPEPIHPMALPVMTEIELSQLRTFEVKDTIHSDPCALCLEDFDDGNRCRQLSCGHSFHAHCIDEWLLTVKGTCPLCRRDALPITPPLRHTSLSASEV